MELVTFWTNQPLSLRAPISVCHTARLPVTQFDTTNIYVVLMTYASPLPNSGATTVQEKRSLPPPVTRVTAARRPAATSCSPGTTSARGELRPELLCRTFGLFSDPWILSATLCHQCILLKHPLAQRRSG